jgi:hypothetical protein
MKVFQSEAEAVARAKERNWLMQVVGHAKSKASVKSKALRAGWESRQLWLVRCNDETWVALMKPNAFKLGPPNTKKRKVK